MRHGWWVLGTALLVACGPPIPDDDDGTGPGCAPGECAPPPSQSLWPMTQGSTWTYKITDLQRSPAPFEKQVRVEGPAIVPGTDREAVLFVSEQPHLTERSWQLEEDGLAKRIREEDLKAGMVVRTTTWSPLTIKALTAAREAGWENRLTVVETVEENGTSDEKTKDFVWRVLAVDVDVVVGGTTLKAVKVQRDREDSTGKERLYWYVPGVGKVREEGERTEELTTYDVKPEA